jgi:hypothetical protein
LDAKRRQPPPPSPGPTYREIVESDRFKKEKAAFGDVKRLDQALHGATFMISWDPMCGQETHNPQIRAIPVGGGFDVSSLVIYYSFNAERVVLESITRGADANGEY